MPETLRRQKPDEDVVRLQKLLSSHGYFHELTPAQTQQYVWFRCLGIGISTALELAEIGYRDQYVKSMVVQAKQSGSEKLFIHRMRNRDLLGDIAEAHLAPQFDQIMAGLQKPNVMSDIENELKPGGTNGEN